LIEKFFAPLVLFQGMNVLLQNNLSESQETIVQN